MVEPHEGCLPPGLKHCSGGRKGHLGQGWQDCPGAPAPITDPRLHVLVDSGWASGFLGSCAQKAEWHLPFVYSAAIYWVLTTCPALSQAFRARPALPSRSRPACCHWARRRPAHPQGCGGEQRVQSELKTDSCHTKSKLLARPWRTSAPLPLPFLFLTRVAHRRFRVLTHCSLKCPFVRTLPLLPDSTQTPNPLGRRLRPSWAKLAAVSSVCPVWFL